MPRESATVPDPHVIVLCGALGDLSRRKLLPGLYRLHHAGLMRVRKRGEYLRCIVQHSGQRHRYSSGGAMRRLSGVNPSIEPLS